MKIIPGLNGDFMGYVGISTGLHKQTLILHH